VSRRTAVVAAVAFSLVVALVARTRAAEPLPARLSETGLYLPGTTTVDPRNRPFSPQYPLWTDGAAKARWLSLPAGARIDAADVDAWEFPAGTRLWKEFAFGGRKVETRMLWRSADGAWHYASYLWNAAQTDATLAPAAGEPQVAEIAPGKWHAVPARDDCRTCHENAATPVLGVSALQLSSDRDPHAPHAEPLAPGMLTVASLAAGGLLANAPAQLATQPPRIPGDARTRAALGYLTGNCGHCHNEGTTIASVRFPLRMPAYATAAEVDAVVASLTSRVTKWDRPHAAPGVTRLVDAGAPDASALVVRMRSRRASSQMPPLGSVVADRDALDLVSAWIAALPRR
jgi:hypothetical protein